MLMVLNRLPLELPGSYPRLPVEGRILEAAGFWVLERISHVVKIPWLSAETLLYEPCLASIPFKKVCL